MRIFLLFFLLSLAGSSFAQSSKKKKSKAELEERQPTSLEPNYSKMDFAPKKSKKVSSLDLTYESQEEYRERMEALIKAKRKNERMMEQPQYSDPMYFGHKRLPKKHKRGKMKYCKVCGIRH